MAGGDDNGRGGVAGIMKGAAMKRGKGGGRLRPRAKVSPKLSKVHNSQILIENEDSVQAVAVDNGATSNKGRGGNLVVAKNHPTNAISLRYTAQSERSHS